MNTPAIARTARAVAVLSILVAGAPGASPPSSRPATKGASSLTYEIDHPLHEVTGVSKEVQCTIEVDDATHVIRSAAFSAEVMSFDSGNSNRDSHAMEVLDALSYPTVSFQSTQIDASGTALHVRGNLTFHGRTKPIDFSATQEQSAGDLTVRGTAAVSLTAFEIERPSLLMIPVKDTLRISFTMVFRGQ